MTTIEDMVAALEKTVAGLVAKQPADASEMAGERGDPEVRRDPKDWVGSSMIGRKYSQCPADFLALLASFFDWRAGKEEQENKMWVSKDGTKSKPMAEFTRRDARIARGWAERNRISGAAVREHDPVTGELTPDAGGADDPLPF